MLITAAPRRTASVIPSALDEQFRSAATLSIRMPGHTPTIPIPFSGAPATAAVAVPCSSAAGTSRVPVRLPPWNSGGCSSACESTSASSGLSGRTAGAAGAPSATTSRQLPTGISGSVSPSRRLRRSGSENVYDPAARAAAARARARPRATTYIPGPIRRAPYRCASTALCRPRATPTIHVARSARTAAAAASPGSRCGARGARTPAAAPPGTAIPRRTDRPASATERGMGGASTLTRPPLNRKVKCLPGRGAGGDRLAPFVEVLRAPDREHPDQTALALLPDRERAALDRAAHLLAVPAALARDADVLRRHPVAEVRPEVGHLGVRDVLAEHVARGR